MFCVWADPGVFPAALGAGMELNQKTGEGLLSSYLPRLTAEWSDGSKESLPQGPEGLLR